MLEFSKSLTGRHILIAEDEVFIAFELIDILEEQGVSVIGPIVQTQDVLPAVLEKRPDAVILDLKLQGVSSLPIAEVLIAMGVPVILATGYLKADIEARFPGVPILEKPYISVDVIATVSALLMGMKGESGPEDATKRAA